MRTETTLLIASLGLLAALCFAALVELGVMAVTGCSSFGCLPAPGEFPLPEPMR